MSEDSSLQEYLRVKPNRAVDRLFTEHSLPEIQEKYAMLTEAIRRNTASLRSALSSNYNRLLECTSLLASIKAFTLDIHSIQLALSATLTDSELQTGPSSCTLIQRIELLLAQEHYAAAILLALPTQSTILSTNHMQTETTDHMQTEARDQMQAEAGEVGETNQLQGQATHVQQHHSDVEQHHSEVEQHHSEVEQHHSDVEQHHSDVEQYYLPYLRVEILEKLQQKIARDKLTEQFVNEAMECLKIYHDQCLGQGKGQLPSQPSEESDDFESEHIIRYLQGVNGSRPAYMEVIFKCKLQHLGSVRNAEDLINFFIDITELVRDTQELASILVRNMEAMERNLADLFIKQMEFEEQLYRSVVGCERLESVLGELRRLTGSDVLRFLMGLWDNYAKMLVEVVLEQCGLGNHIPAPEPQTTHPAEFAPYLHASNPSHRLLASYRAALSRNLLLLKPLLARSQATLLHILAPQIALAQHNMQLFIDSVFSLQTGVLAVLLLSEFQHFLSLHFKDYLQSHTNGKYCDQEKQKEKQKSSFKQKETQDNSSSEKKEENRALEEKDSFEQNEDLEKKEYISIMDINFEVFERLQFQGNAEQALKTMDQYFIHFDIQPYYKHQLKSIILHILRGMMQRTNPQKTQEYFMKQKNQECLNKHIPVETLISKNPFSKKKSI